MKYGVGIDVSKGKSTVAILSIEGEVIEMPFNINHDVEDLEKLDTKLQKFSKEGMKHQIDIFLNEVISIWEKQDLKLCNL